MLNLTKGASDNRDFCNFYTKVTEGSNKINPLKAGDFIPQFTLTNLQGQQINIQTLLAQSSLLLLFDRGQWCPYDSLELWKLQRSLPKVLAADVKPAIISSKPSKHLVKVLNQQSLNFEVLVDQDLKVARKFGLVQQFLLLSNSTYKHFESRGFKAQSLSQSNNHFERIVHAVYEVNSDGKVSYDCIDLTYRNTLNNV
ncbi:MAG: redoxin domain-containing protein [Microcoleaceae cyanobacterium]